MARRVIILIAAASLAFATAAFASGQKDTGTVATPGASGAIVLQGGVTTTGPKLTLSGTLTVQNLIHPTLKSGDKVYELLVPRRLVYDAGVKDGAKLSIEGYQAANLPAWEQVADGVAAVVVTKATIDGKDYDLSQLRGPRMGRGDGNGPGQGRGGRGGMMGSGRGM